MFKHTAIFNQNGKNIIEIKFLKGLQTDQLFHLEVSIQEPIQQEMVPKIQTGKIESKSFG